MLDTRIILAFLWASLALVFLLGDVFRLYSGDAKPGEISGKKIKKIVWLPISMVMVMPIVMIPLTLILENPLNRTLNLVITIFFFVFNIISLKGYSAYDKFLLFVSFGFNILSFWYAWNWI